MVKLIFILTLIFITCLLQQYNTKELFTETEETIQSKLNWLNSKSDEITKGSIEYKYTEEKGFHCVSKKNLSRNESIFNIPKHYVITNCKSFLYFR